MISLICRNCGKQIHFNDMNLSGMIDTSEKKETDNVLNQTSKESFQNSTKTSLLNETLPDSQDGYFVEESFEKLNSIERVELVNDVVTDGNEETKNPSLQNLKQTLSALQALQAYLVRNSLSNHKTTEASTPDSQELDNQPSNITKILHNLNANYLPCFLCLSELRARLQQAIQSCRNECSMYSDYLSSALSSKENKSYDQLKKQRSISNIPSENENFSDPENLFVRRNSYDLQLQAKTSKKSSIKHKKKKNILCATRMKCAPKYPLPSSSAFITSEQNNLHYNRMLLSVLTRTNVVEDAFRIEVSGMYGVINGLRLGKMPDDSVSWNEVNAAWGQSAFLLDTVAQLVLKIYMNYVRSLKEKNVNPNSTSRKLNAISREFVADFPSLTYLKTHKVVPRGNQSVVLRRADMSCYELYRTDGGLTQYFATKRFNAAMTLFLEITKELITVGCFLKKKLNKDEQTSTLRLKAISDMVRNSSIHLPCSSGGESWCQCLKDLLLNCQWLLQLNKDIHNCFLFPREQ